MLPAQTKEENEGGMLDDIQSVVDEYDQEEDQEEKKEEANEEKEDKEQDDAGMNPLY